MTACAHPTILFDSICYMVMLEDLVRLDLISQIVAILVLHRTELVVIIKSEGKCMEKVC